MSFFSKIKEFFKGKDQESQELISEVHNKAEAETESKEELITQLNKFDAEFHNPRLQCFYCNQTIESGRVRFFKAPGQTEESAFHKRCFKKLKEGKLPGQ